MSVRKRTWTTRKGEQKESWIVDYTDQNGERHIQTFDRKKDADDCHAAIKVDVGKGVHTAHSKSLSIAQAAENWIKYVELEKRERTTVVQYRNHVDNHINPRLGRERLAKLTTPRIQAFRDELLAALSRAQAKKVLTSLKSLLKDAQRRGHVAQNVAVSVSIKRDNRDKARLKVGVDIPTPDEIKRIIHAATGRMRRLLIVAIFTGLRSSELRGLRWDDVDLEAKELHVRQRADRYNEMGKPKSEAGERVIPLGPMVVNTLREWRLACPRGELGLALPNAMGKIWNHAGIVRAMCRTMVAAGVVDAEGEAKYTGLHSLRHFYASWCINRKADGGLELPAKSVQARMGHSSIVITMDTYGHLFPNTDDGSELAEAEKALLA
ncbi:MAG: tyrosine-type recombinase/integrase [Pseudolabrys sp.]